MEYCKSSAGFFLRLYKGENVLQTLAEFVNSQNLGGAFFTGLGAICGVRLGYYDIHKKIYLDQRYESDVELCNMTGNVSYVEGAPIAHVHATIMTEKFETYSGHLFEARVAVTCEVNLVTTEVRMTRQLDPETGLKLLKLKTD